MNKMNRHIPDDTFSFALIVALFPWLPVLCFGLELWAVSTASVLSIALAIGAFFVYTSKEQAK